MQKYRECEPLRREGRRSTFLLNAKDERTNRTNRQNHNESEWRNDGRNEESEFQFTADSGVKNVPVDPSNILAVFKTFFFSW